MEELPGRRMCKTVGEQQFLDKRFGSFFMSETACGALQGISLQALDNLVDANSLLCVDTADGKRIYPELQFDDAGSLVQGLPGIFQILLPAATDGWTVLYWLTAPLDAYESRTAVEVLQSGNARETEAILKMAKKDAARWLNV